MAELVLRLEIDPVTGKKNVVIDYGSDAEALPMEHEEDHRRLVDRLLEGGTLRAAELGKIVVKRGEAEEVVDEEAASTPDERQGVHQGE